MIKPKTENDGDHEHPTHGGGFIDCHDYATDAEDGGIEDHPDSHHQEELHLGHIIGATRDE